MSKTPPRSFVVARPADDDPGSLEETLAILSDTTTLDKIREGDAAIAAGDAIALDDLPTRTAPPPSRSARKQAR
jgi:PHD/YefM family antitoxin component YafN of YafNO toxin-antitoxin module